MVIVKVALPFEEMSGASKNRKGKGNANIVVPTVDGPGSGAGPSGTSSVSHRGSVAAQSVTSQHSTTLSPRLQGPSSPRLPGDASQMSGSYGAPPATSIMTDPALERPALPLDVLRLMDLPASMYNFNFSLDVAVEYTKRPGFNTTGNELTIGLNFYRVSKYPSREIWQYDLNIGNGAEKRVIIEKVWKSRIRLQHLPDPMLFDGNKLGWTTHQHKPEISFVVDLDVEEGRRPNPNSKNSFRVTCRRTKKINLAVIEAFLANRLSFSNDVLEAFNFCQHLLRQGASTNPQLLALKNSFFSRSIQAQELGGGVEVWRGIFQSLRPVHPGSMSVNLDVANTCFWRSMSLQNLMINRFKQSDVNDLALTLRPGQDGQPSGLFSQLRQLKKLRVTVDYQNMPATVKGREFIIKGFINQNAKQYELDITDKDGRTVKTSVYDYFRRKYNVTLRHHNLPLCEMTKKGVMYPIEVIQVSQGNKYNYKLDELQTSNMIKFAVSRPHERIQAIEEGKNLLSWGNDRWMKHFGMEINPNMVKTKARVLPNPQIEFGGNQRHNPGTSGRWDLRGKRFFALPGNPLVSWGIGFFPRTLNSAQRTNFAQALMKQYKGHGATVNNEPFMMDLPQDPVQAAAQLFTSTGNRFRQVPQILVFVVQNKDSWHYHRIKRATDCYHGVVSQVVQSQQASKGNPQYLSNVLMKFNAKLGGSTCKAHAQHKGYDGLRAGTMFIGCDVSHPSPGSEQPSTAALTMSIDRPATRYAAAVQSNGHRVEMVTEANFKSMLKPLVTYWISNVAAGRSPTQVFYMRDGVSEGQYQQVLQQEVPRINAVMREVCGGKPWEGQITVIIASKRHHVRAFPDGRSGDRFGNPLPGTLVERDCTTPHDWDFYLYSHTALQGTSRPVKYTVLRDDAKHSPNHLQNLIYDQCYQYIRSTTSVSLHPAVYYAHLASKRAKAHEDTPDASGPTGGPGHKMAAPSSSEGTAGSTEVPMLKPLCVRNQQGRYTGIEKHMWFV
ncbi:putative eukaryotic translation initiation factor 2c [Phaeomoniella chlamydospora]|uniref:Putative eukaryotic translation initiation factor 2c n=1 Tax=Phaeomoniella chlamydospora TaxID=158046 RepID=A0A0G2DWN9_PHACM|nr:putative eukaryotic translation initiation factor 2c [Phaeomoniella chlamydospora]